MRWGGYSGTTRSKGCAFPRDEGVICPREARNESDVVHVS